MFNNDPEVVALVAKVFPIMALGQMFDGLSIIAAGILRATGRQVRKANFYRFNNLFLPYSLLVLYLTFGSSPTFFQSSIVN